MVRLNLVAFYLYMWSIVQHTKLWIQWFQSDNNRAGGPRLWNKMPLNWHNCDQISDCDFSFNLINALFPIVVSVNYCRSNLKLCYTPRLHTSVLLAVLVSSEWLYLDIRLDRIRESECISWPNHVRPPPIIEWSWQSLVFFSARLNIVQTSSNLIGLD